MKKSIVGLVTLMLMTCAQAQSLVEYRFTLDVEQQSESAQDTGFGANKRNKANVTKVVTFYKESGTVVFNQTIVPAFGSMFDSKGNMQTNERMVASSSDNVAKCAFDNLSWPYKYLEVGMTHREGKDWVIIAGTFRSEKIYEDCRQYSPLNREQQDHSYVQEEEEVNKRIDLDVGETYTYQFKNQRIKSTLSIERLK